VKGIEINAYAAELARVTVWIGQIQWMISHGFSANRKPILEPLHTIENRDALIEIQVQNLSPLSTQSNAKEKQYREAEWPEAEFIIGNPPFLGVSKLLNELGENYMNSLRSHYAGRVPAGADLVTYWFAKSKEQMDAGKAKSAGLVATNSIRGGANRKVLDYVVESTSIYEAWSDEAWVVDGAAVRVSLICFGNQKGTIQLDGCKTVKIHTNLTGGSTDLTKARRLSENMGVMFMGASKKGSLDVSGEQARAWLTLHGNPNARPNADVLKPLWNAIDVTRRPRDKWAIDFGTTMGEQDAALYEAPFQHVQEVVKPEREKNNDRIVRENWWRFARPRIDMREGLAGISRYIATPAVAKHRIFTWMHGSVLPDQALLVVGCDNDAAFGILHSRFHELWSLGLCTFLGVGNDPRYTPTTCFETFPFPKGFDFPLRNSASSVVKGFDFDSIAQAAKRLDELRNNWLNPSEWVERIPEVVTGYPDRIIAKPGHEADLKKRTLTNLYNARPAWLDNIHKELDAAVATAYGWDDYTPAMPDEEILARLFKLNQDRAVK